MVQVGKQKLSYTGHFQESQIRYIIKSTGLDSAGSILGAKRQSLSKLIAIQGGRATRLCDFYFFLTMTKTDLPLTGQRVDGGWQMLQHLSHLTKRP